MRPYNDDIGFTAAVIDDIVNRGPSDDWLEAAQSDPTIVGRKRRPRQEVHRTSPLRIEIASSPSKRRPPT